MCEIAPGTINTLGGLLQLAGIGTVAWGISKLREEFGEQPIWLVRAIRAVGRFLRRLLRRSQDALVRPATISTRAVVHGVDARVTRTWELLETDRERIEELKRRQDEVSQDLRDATAETKARLDNLDTLLSSEKVERSQAVGELQQTIKSLATGGLRLETAGVILLAFGVGLTTWPEAVTSFVDRLC